MYDDARVDAYRNTHRLLTWKTLKRKADNAIADVNLRCACVAEMQDALEGEFETQRAKRGIEHAISTLEEDIDWAERWFRLGRNRDLAFYFWEFIDAANELLSEKKAKAEDAYYAAVGRGEQHLPNVADRPAKPSWLDD